MDEAERLYQRILHADPNQPVALNLLGVLAHQTGRSDAAADLIAKALAINPDYAEAHNNLGNVLRNQGNPYEAVASYRRALALAPDNAKAHYNLGNALRDMGRLEEAVASFHQARLLKPGNAELHNNLGNALNELGKLDEAADHYRQAIAIAPKYAKAHYNLGVVLRDMGKQNKAVASYRRALAIAPDYAEAHGNLGNALRDLGMLDDAVASYRRALAIAPDLAEAHSNLGDVLQNLGKSEEAVASYHKALAIAPDNAETYRHLAHAKKFTRLDDDIKAMEAAYAAPGLNDEQKMHLAFGLGKSFEDLRQYDKAFGYFRTGNAIKRGAFEFSIERVEENFEKVKNIFTEARFSGHQGGSSDETPIFILGMPRSGTTLVEQILASHPRVHGSGELSFLSRAIVSSFGQIDDSGFAESLDQASIGAFSSAGVDYIGMIRKQAEPLEFITDKMPLNFRFIGMIRLMLPQAKIIHCRRDPLDTCLSIFKNYFSGDGNYYAYDLGELGRYYTLYRDLMRHWHGVLPGFIHDIHYEDLVADQEQQSRALLAYCGLEWDDACLAFHRTERPIQTASAAQVRRPIYKDSVRSWKRYEEWLAPLVDALADRQPTA